MLVLMPAAEAEQAGDEDRTRIIALEGRGSTIELPPHARTLLAGMFAEPIVGQARTRLSRRHRDP